MIAMASILAHHIRRHRHLLPIAWLSATVATIILTLTLLISSLNGNSPTENLKYTIYAAKPLVLGAATFRLEHGDSRAELINSVFEKYNCPMAGLGEKFVAEADKNEIPYWIVASIAFQESSCGKKVPIVGGQSSFNAYGYGVWGNNITMFDSWEHGIEVMSRYMHKMFFSKGTDDLCEIMKTYTPPSEGSWCEGVEFFKKEITEFQSPE